LKYYHSLLQFRRMEYLSNFYAEEAYLFLDGIKTAAAVVVAWVTYSGLQVWKEKKTGTLRHDLALKVLRKIYELEYKVREVRGHPYAEWALESIKEIKELEEKRFRDGVADMDGIEREIRLLSFEGRVLWDSEVVLEVEKLIRYTHKLFTTIPHFFSTFGDLGVAENATTTDEMADFVTTRSSYAPILFSGAARKENNGKDEIALEIAQNIKKIEDLLAPDVHLENTKNAKTSSLTSQLRRNSHSG